MFPTDQLPRFCHIGMRGGKVIVDEVKLEPCPFCGGEAKTKSGVDVIPAYDENGAYVDYEDIIYNEQTGCPACDIWFYISEDEPDGITIERWNRRETNA